MSDESASISPLWLGILDIVVWTLIIATIVWLCVMVFEYFILRSHNLTRAETTAANKDIELDFLKKDQGKRDAALEAADAYRREIDPQAPPKAAEGLSRLKRLAAVASTIMAVITLIAVIAGTLMRLDYATELIEGAGFDQVSTLMDRYPVGVYVAGLVIVYHIVAFFVLAKWRSDSA